MKSILFLLFFTLSIGAIAYASNPCTKVEYKGVEVITSLSKETYLDGEPIILTISLENKTQETLSLVDLMYGSYCGTTVNIVIDPIPQPNRQISRYKPYPDSKWDFKPGEKHTIEVDVQWIYRYLIGEGSYTLDVIYTGPTLVTGGSVDKPLPLPQLKFQVISADGPDAENARLYKEMKHRGYMSKNNIQGSIGILDKLSSLKNAENISGYASCASAMASGDSGDKLGMIEKYRTFLKKYPDLPCYGQLVVQKLTLALMNNKDYSGAKEILYMMKDVCQRRKLTSICDKQIARTVEK